VLQVCNFLSFRNYDHFLTSLTSGAQRSLGAVLLGRGAQRTPLLDAQRPLFLGSTVPVMYR
jgi:hypothetical protein